MGRFSSWVLVEVSSCVGLCKKLVIGWVLAVGLIGGWCLLVFGFWGFWDWLLLGLGVDWDGCGGKVL